MVDESGSWRQLIDLARQEVDLENRRKLCAQARKIIQDSLVEIGDKDPAARAALENNLRQIWNLENEGDFSARPN